MIIGFVGMILIILFCPIVASIVGAIISKNFDDEGDAAFNGAITGAIGTGAMVFVAMFVMSHQICQIQAIYSSKEQFPLR